MDDKSITFAKYFEKWFELYREPKVKEVTAQKYLFVSNQIDKSNLGQMRLDNIKRKDVQKFLNEYGRTRRKETVLDFRRLINASFVDAVHDDLIKVNPCARTEIVSVEDEWGIKQLKSVREQKKWLEIDEYKKTKLYLIGVLNLSFSQDMKTELVLKNSASKVATVLKPTMYPTQMSLMVIYVALKTGARLSEILGITKDDIDTKSGQLNIDKTWDYKFGKGFIQTKNTASIRTINMDFEFFKVMQSYLSWLSKYDIKTDQGAVFIESKARFHNSTTNRLLKMIFKILNIEPITLHKLRHTHASILIAEGVSSQVVAKRLGHTDTNMVQTTYGHLLKSVEKTENKRILELI